METALFTNISDELIFDPNHKSGKNWMFRLWMNYYRREFGNNIFILYIKYINDPCPDILNYPKMRKIWVKRRHYHKVKDEAIKYQTDLLKHFQVVVHADFDEFIIPAEKSLKEYISSFKQPDVLCNGYNVIHFKGEPEFDFKKPILRQREYWRKGKIYCKPAISRHPLQWTGGFHKAKNMLNPVIDPELYLVHMKWASNAWLYEEIFEEFYGTGLFYTNLEPIPDNMRDRLILNDHKILL